jgi:hypothetical protein
MVSIGTLDKTCLNILKQLSPLPVHGSALRALSQLSYGGVVARVEAVVVVEEAVHQVLLEQEVAGLAVWVDRFHHYLINLP